MSDVRTAAAVLVIFFAGSALGYAWRNGPEPGQVSRMEQASTACASNRAYTRALLPQCVADFYLMKGWAR